MSGPAALEKASRVCQAYGMHYEHLAILKKKFNPINPLGRVRTLRLHNGRRNPGAPTRAIIGSGHELWLQTYTADHVREPAVIP